MEKTTDEKLIKLTWKNFILMMVAVIGVTNTANYLIHQQQVNTEKIDYNHKADSRRNEHLRNELMYQLQLHDLKEKLNNCLNNK